MRIGYFGDGPWAHKALDLIGGTPEIQVAFVVPRYRRPDAVLQEYADRLDVPFLSAPDVNTDEFLGEVNECSADLHVSMSFNQIVRRALLESAPMGFINCHAGALPYYRGRNVLNWALINGEETFGVTVHYMDEGIDSGDIIVQEHVHIGKNDAYGEVLARAHERCARTLHKALLRLLNGSAPRIPQESIHPVGFYCGRRRPGDELIDWTAPSERVHNFVRGISLPGPGARTFMDDQEIAVLRAALIDGAPEYIGTPGEVVGRNDRGIVVKTGSRTIRLTEIADVATGGELINRRTPVFAIGCRFTSQNAAPAAPPA